MYRYVPYGLMGLGDVYKPSERPPMPMVWMMYAPCASMHAYKFFSLLNEKVHKDDKLEEHYKFEKKFIFVGRLVEDIPTLAARVLQEEGPNIFAWLFVPSVLLLLLVLLPIAVYVVERVVMRLYCKPTHGKLKSRVLMIKRKN